MGRFSDSPYYILEDFLENQINYGYLYNTYVNPDDPSDILYTPAFNSLDKPYVKTGYVSPALPPARLWGGRKGIIAAESYGFNIYLKTDIKYYRLNLRNLTGSPNGDFFTFIVNEDSFDSSELTMEQIIGNAEISEFGAAVSLIGSELYFQKESNFYDFVDNYSPADHNEVNTPNINTNKFYIYLGKLYATNANEIIIKYEGYKTYVNNFIPENNRSALLSTFTDLCFDSVYGAQYNKFKNLLSLSDPTEADINYLYYISRMYNMTIPESLSDTKKREYVSALPELLKRKGTFYSLYIIWKVMCSNTTNFLNIYERWNDWPHDDVVYPIENFSDVFYIFNPLYKATPPRTGAGVEYYYSGSGTNYVTRVAEPATDWTVMHNIGYQWPFVQIINDDDECIIPNEISFDSQVSLSVDFGTDMVAGKVISCPSTGDLSIGNTGTFFTENISIPSNTWSVNHGLNVKYPLVQVVNLNNKLIIPEEIEFVDENNLTITFNEAIQGKVIVGLTAPDSYTEAISAGGYTWEIEHNLATQNIIIQVVGADDKQIIPETIKILDDNNIEMTFSDFVDGNVVVYSSVGLSPYPIFTYEDYMLSPHYLVEMDLTNEPYGDDYIINYELITEIIARWEELRPVCKYAHYREVIAPITDFSGKDIELYVGTTKTGSMLTKCCQPVRQIVEPEAPATFIYRTYANRVLWTINHQLNSAHTIVQCFDLNQNMMIPNEIFEESENVTVITWDVPTAGYAYVSKNDVSSTQASNAVWTVTHSLGLSASTGMLLQQAEYDATDTVFMPATVKIVDIDTLEYTMVEATSGYAMVSTGSYEVSASAPLKDWTINHNLNSAAIQAQFYNERLEVMYPQTVRIVDENNITISFDDFITPGVVIKRIGLVSEEKTGVYESIANLKIGSGGSIDWDPILKNGLEYGTDITYVAEKQTDSDTQYFVKATINTREDLTITEFGLFDSSDNIIFYTRCDLIYKPKDVELILWFRINKTMA